jgi:outer membrane protein assembly factor BamB
MKRKTLIALLLLLAAGGSILTGCLTWGDQANYEIVSSTLPTSLAWKFEADEPIIHAYLSPTFIYFTGYNSIYAVSRATGEELWKVERDHITLLIPPLATDSHMVLVVTNNEKFIEALNVETGESRWRVSVKDAVSSDNASVSAVTVDANQVFVGAFLSRGTKIFALQLDNGKQIWDSPQELPEVRPRELMVYDKWLAVEGGDLWYLNRDNGVVTFRKLLPKANRFVFGTDQIYAISDGEDIKALDPLSIAEQWNFQGQCQHNSYWIYLSPTLPSDVLLVFVACDREQLYGGGTFYRLATQSGEIAWMHQIGSGPFLVLATIMGNYSYYLLDDGSVHALDLRGGQEVGALYVQPAEVRDRAGNERLVSDSEILVLLMGNQQAFAFKNN